MRIAVDAMGGDHAPEEIVKGAIQYSLKHLDNTVILVGDKPTIAHFLEKHGGAGTIKILHTDQAIKMDAGVDALREFPKASIIETARAVRSGQADAMVAMGNTAVAMACATLYIGRLPDIKRPPIAILLPTIAGGRAVLLDGGAVVDCDCENLKQFALMGSIYAKKVLGIDQPRVRLLSIGEEDKKGNKIVRETGEILRKFTSDDLPYLFEGNIEGTALFSGIADVVVADGFCGNVAIKTIEGLLGYMKSLIKEDRRLWFPALLAYPLFRALKSRIDSDEYGGAPLLGLNGVCIIGHGKSKANAVEHAIEMAAKTFRSGIVEAIKESLRIIS